METVEVTFKYTQSEYVKAERLYLFSSNTITRTSIVILGIYLAFALFLFFHSPFDAISCIILGVALLASAIAIYVYFYAPAYKFKQTEKYHEEYTLLFAKNCIKFKTATIDSELQWSLYSELWESADYYFLLYSGRMYTLIPKRVFANSASRRAFEDIALSSLNRAKRMV